MSRVQTSPLLRRMVGFYAIPLLSILASLGTLPVIARHVDARTWVAIAVGQGVGSVASIAAAAGWNFNGPIQLIGKHREVKAQLYGESLTSRLLMTLVVTPVAGAIAVVASPRGTATEASAFAVSTCLLGLSCLWFCVGEGRPGWATLYDVGPRVGVSLVGAGLILYGAPVVLLAILLGLNSLLCPALFARLVRVKYGSIRPERSIPAVLAQQLSGMLTSFVAGAYSTAAVALVSISTSTSQAATFASGARFYSLALFGISVATQAVLADTRRGRQTRGHLTSTLGIYAGTGCVGLIGLGVLAGWVSRHLLTQTFGVAQPDAAFFGLSYLFVALGTWLSQVILLPLGDRAWNLSSVSVGLVVGIPSIMALTRASGSSGGALGLALSEFAVLFVLAVGGHHVRRRRPPADSLIAGIAANPSHRAAETRQT